MFFWFAGLAFVGVVLVFGSAAIDYRLVMAGAVLPSLELIWGGPWIMHTLAFPVAAMTLTMLVLAGKRLAQRRWLGLTIGFFLHLVLAGTWRLTSLFWWPGFGLSIDPQHAPSLPPLGFLLVMELIGLAALAWCVSRFGLLDKNRQHRFLTTGKLDRTLLSQPDTGVT